MDHILLLHVGISVYMVPGAPPKWYPRTLDHIWIVVVGKNGSASHKDIMGVSHFGALCRLLGFTCLVQALPAAPFTAAESFTEVGLVRSLPLPMRTKVQLPAQALSVLQLHLWPESEVFFRWFGDLWERMGSCSNRRSPEHGEFASVSL